VSDPRHEYERRLAHWNVLVQRGDRRHRLIANLRLGVAAIAALTAWLAFGRGGVAPFWILLPAAAFLVLVVVHARVLYRNERASRARDLYRRGLARLEGRWAGVGSDGARFLNDHPYARDLDLFGPASLFQLVNAAHTEAGEETLADWLRTPAAVDEIGGRQEAVRELAPLIDFREGLAIVAAETHVGRTSALARWAAQTPLGLSWATAALFAVCGALTGVLVTAALLGRIPASIALAWALVQVVVAARWRRVVAEAVRRVDAPSDDLGLFRELLETIEDVRFSAPRLVALHEQLVEGGTRPSRHIARLESLVSLLNQCEHNPYFRALAAPLLIRFQVAVAIDRWHASHARALGRWLVVVGELEALVSFANHAFERPLDPMPSIEAGGPLLDAAGIAHPLLPEEKAVRNDIALGGSGSRVLIVSGSNMSGKSTLLRAAGVNTVLALAGAPVRATRMRLSPLAIGATLRIEDSLQEGHSRFFTEILRVRSIVELARGPVPVLFLLDEILHGTNSYDRRIGAEAIVRALVEAGAVGLVTTHDLALTELVSRLGAPAANVHFEDRIENGRIVFDYRMRAGVVQRSNALALMRTIGLDV
jgi:hypothetical protein